jgi:ribosomal protein L37AE/L43A
MTQMRERKCCPECGTLAIQLRVRTRDHYCMKCKMVVVPMTTQAGTGPGSKPKFGKISSE